MENEIGIPVNPTEWRNGSLVALKTHFYSKEIHSDLIIYSGEPKLISPLMIIVESQPEKDGFDSSTGDELTKKGAYQCKCIWFSNKTFQIEEARISSRLLQIIEEGSVETRNKLQYGDLVELKGCGIELGKKKSSLRFKNNSTENTVTAELSFVSPIMQVIGTTKNEIKEPLRDPNTQKPKRFISKTLIKCKYYNSMSEKMVEVLIPIEALNDVPKFDSTYLSPLKIAVESGQHLVINVETGDKEKPKKQILIDPKKINYRAGRYYLSAFNFFNAKTQEFKLPIEYTIPNPWFTEELPSFKEISSKLSYRLVNPDTLKELIGRMEQRKYLLITYQDINEVETKRVVDNPQLIIEEGKSKDPKDEIPTYLKAFCHLRNDTRYFKIDRIKTIKVLNL